MSIFSKMASGYKRLLDEGQKSEWATAEITEYGIFNIPKELKHSENEFDDDLHKACSSALSAILSSTNNSAMNRDWFFDEDEYHLMYDEWNRNNDQ